MATKSPGIYFTETDNTQYENPKSISGTTLAVVGYASKGPIGIPTEINSWRDFVSTFGKPLNGYYSGLAVKNFLSAGGSVLFLRVADSTASPSNYIVKNPVAEKKGYITFTKTTDIMPSAIEAAGAEKIFGFKLAPTASEIKSGGKFFFVRPPAKGRRLTQASVVNQISKQLAATPATFETKLRTPSTIIDGGFYGFNIKVDEDPIGSTSDYYIETYKDESKESIAESIKSLVKDFGTNAMVEITLDLQNKATGAIQVNSPEKDFSSIISGRKVFKYVNKGKEEKVEIEFTTGESGTLTLKDIAHKIDKKMNDSYGIRVFLIQGSQEKNQGSRLVFVSKNKVKDESFQISGLDLKDKDIKNSLFMAQQQQEGKKEVTFEDTDAKFVCEELPGTDHLFLPTNGYEHAQAKASSITEGQEFDITYDVTSESIILTTQGVGSTKKIELVDSKYSEYDTSKEITLKGNVFASNFKLAGQNSIDVTVSQNKKTGKVTFEGFGIDAPALAKVGNDPFIGETLEEKACFGEFLDLEKDEQLKPSGEGYDDPVQGNASVPASARDQVVFTSRELGSGTDNIEVEIYTTVNPLDKEDVKHNLIVYVDGNRREAFEDISLNPDDGEDYFVAQINKTVENGGSAYIVVKGIKKIFDEQHKEIELPDGRYKLGKANKSGDRAKPSDSLISDYNNYEYAVGTNGIPEVDGNLLFAEAMTPGTSFLANKELYDFHILIAPDDISDVVQDASIKLCEDRGDAIAIVDPPQELDKKAVIAWHNGRGAGRTTPLDSNYVATYWPWCKIFDNSTGSGKFTWVMPSVIMAAQYVRVDRSAGCHMAPAGEVNGILPVIDIEQYPNKLDRDELYTDYNRINPLTKFKDGTVVAYGEKTTQRTNSVLTKIHTRRMLIQIKKQCRAALRGYIFMPNTVDYLGKIGNNITAILEGYKAKGGLSFYKVICDETNNPTEVRQQDIINVDVVLVPEGTIEQININLTLNKSAETVED